LLICRTADWQSASVPPRCACEMRNPSGTQTRSVPYVAGNKPPKGVTGRDASTFRKAGRL
jgi:hypothetical protein